MRYCTEKEKELKQHIIPQTKPADFEEFWRDAVETLRKVPLKIERTRKTLPYDKTFTTYEISYSTHDDTVVNAYFSVPGTGKGERRPCVAYFHGGGGCRRVFPDIVSTGVCCFAIDVRSQGGSTCDKAAYTLCDDFRGALMTHDVLWKDRFYMKNIYLDAIRAIDVIASLPEVDPARIVTYGSSQGGALSIVAAALSGSVLKTYPTVPSYACLKERVELGSGVFRATKEYLIKHPADTDRVLDTLSYFDINNMVSLLKTPAVFFLGLIDPVCLPEFVYSPYAHTAAPKEIYLSPFTPHTISEEHKMRIYNDFAAL